MRKRVGVGQLLRLRASHVPSSLAGTAAIRHGRVLPIGARRFGFTLSPAGGAERKETPRIEQLHIPVESEAR